MNDVRQNIMTAHPRASKLGRALIYYLAYLALAILLTWPLVSHLNSHLPQGTDSLTHYWRDWWVWQALSAGQSPYQTPLLFYPNGLSLVFSNFAWLHIVPWLGLRPLLGGVAAYNLIFLLNLALCGLALFWLAYELTKNKLAAFLAGLIYQSWPHRLTQPSHPNLISTWAIPLFLLFLYRLLTHKRWQDGLLAGVFLALVGYMRWQLLIPAVLMGGILIVFMAPKKLDRQAAAGLLLAGLIALLLLAPPMILLGVEWQNNPIELIIAGEEIALQTDVLAYLTPPGLHPLFGEVTQSLYESYYPDRGSRVVFSPYIGIVTLLLVVLGVWKGGLRRALPWLVMGLILVWLALGPTLRLNGHQYESIPMLYSLAERLFIFRLMREPDRFNMFLALPISILAAYGFNYLLEYLHDRPWYSRRRAAGVVVAVIGAIILFEYLTIPMPLQPVDVSPFYGQLAEESSSGTEESSSGAEEVGDFAILNVPVDPYKSKSYMFAQVTHGRPILQGRSTRYPRDAFAYLESQPWLHAMGQYDQIPPKQGDVSRQLANLAGEGVRYLILHKALLTADSLVNWRHYLALPPVYEDETILVYGTELADGSTLTLKDELQPGFGLLQSLVSARCLDTGRTIGLGLAWGAAQPPDQDYAARLVFVSDDSASGKKAEESLYSEVVSIGGEPTSQWPAGAVNWDFYSFSIPEATEPGSYRLVLQLVNDETRIEVGDKIVLSDLVLSTETCPAAGSTPAIQENALFGDELRLAGYQLDKGEQELALTLDWRAERRMENDYKVFIHIFDPQTGAVVAQDDAMPRRWRYPTSYWWPGEIVQDRIEIALEDVAPGRYGVAVGVYHPENGERLPLLDSSGRPVVDGRLVFGEIDWP